MNGAEIKVLDTHDCSMCGLYLAYIRSVITDQVGKEQT